ncbi:MAG: hypothetical protein HRT90_04715 [Candidatus Margulisbacteria bacterium]|nr:hypothetical protein [Candidatus Margulisiibacteriota bacterium]
MLISTIRFTSRIAGQCAQRFNMRSRSFHAKPNSTSHTPDPGKYDAPTWKDGIVAAGTMVVLPVAVIYTGIVYNKHMTKPAKSPDKT